MTDEVFNFLLVWYYCTLTIRESILISNGSRYCATCKDYLKHEMSLKEKQAMKVDSIGTESQQIQDADSSVQDVLSLSPSPVSPRGTCVHQVGAGRRRCSF